LDEDVAGGGERGGSKLRMVLDFCRGRWELGWGLWMGYSQVEHIIIREPEVADPINQEFDVCPGGQRGGERSSDTLVASSDGDILPL
jgi:hypothetical protein